MADRSIYLQAESETSISDLLHDLRTGERQPSERSVIPTGYLMLDRALEGGLHAGDLIVLGGMPGSGKTIAAMQWARNMAAAGSTVLYICYEHDLDTLLARLLACEIGEMQLELDQEALAAIRGGVRAVMARDMTHADLRHPILRAGLAGIEEYADRLILAHANASVADVGYIEDRVLNGGRDYNAVVVDYLQKVPGSQGRAQGVNETVQALKDLSMEANCALIAVSAVAVTEVGVKRLRMTGLQGADMVAHEADLVVTLNPKLNIVSRDHLAFDPTRFDEFNQAVVFTIEKNRRGLAALDLEFEKDFANFRFIPRGAFVAERLVDGLITHE